MPFLPAPAPEPRHIRGGAGGAGRGQWTSTPLRVVVDATAYADVDTKIYVKVKALSTRRRCEASVPKIAAYVDVAASTAEKSLGRLSRPAPTDGVTELFRKQRSHKGTGNGRTNERWCRTLDQGERHVWAPVLAADTLRGTLHRLYLLLRYTVVVEKRDLALAEIAAVLRHHGGKNAGKPLHETTVARLLDELEQSGWITQDKRAGYRGRHAVTVHDDPVRPADAPDDLPPHPGAPAPATPDAEGGAAPDHEGGALAYKEDHQPLNDRGSTHRRGSSAVGEVTVSGRPPVDTGGNGTRCGGVPTSAVPASLRGRVRPAAPPAYAGPQLALSPRVWAVLEPVRDLLPGIRPYVLRRIAREIGRQIDAGFLAADVRDQIARLRGWTPAEDVPDPGRWLLGAVLPVRSRCGRPGCHFGFLAHTGAPCKTCEEISAARARAAHPPHTAAWHECAQCQAPSRHRLPRGLCRTCA